MTAPVPGTEAPLRPKRGRFGALIIAPLLLAVAALAAALWWAQRSKPAPPVVTAEVPAPLPASGGAMAPPALAPASAPVPEPAPEPGPLAAPDVGNALIALLGRQPVLTFLQVDEFPRRLVATVDNLGRSQAPALAWPVNPTPGRFTVVERDGATYVDPDNSARYTPLILAIEQVDAAQAADLYVRLLPLLQKSYQDIGFPNKRFHTRLLEVIDELLATPEAPQPLRVKLTEVKGPVASARPWVRYEFADPALEAASAGQKILLRMGPVNERRVKAKLADFRRALAERVPRR